VSDGAYRCGHCGFEWRGERLTCPRCREVHAQPALFDAPPSETREEDVERINEESADPATEWVGLPEFVAADESFKVVISCDTERDRDDLFELLGITTVHKGTRGTLSVWWPDRPREDLSSLRFEQAGIPRDVWSGYCADCGEPSRCYMAKRCEKDVNRPAGDCPNRPDLETGEWPCDPDESGTCRTCGLSEDDFDFDLGDEA